MTVFRVDHWLRSFNSFYTAYEPDPIGEDLTVRKDRIQNPAVAKILGCNFPKLQLFSQIHLMSDDEQIVDAITDAKYKGDMIFTNKPITSSKAKNLAESFDLSANDRLPGKIDVIEFNSNKLLLKIQIPINDKGILFYSDAWHPFWKAFVNGEPVKIYKANLGFKAVEVINNSLVEFRFSSKILDLVFLFLILNSWFLFIFLVYHYIQIFKPGIHFIYQRFRLALVSNKDTPQISADPFAEGAKSFQGQGAPYRELPR